MKAKNAKSVGDLKDHTVGIDAVKHSGTKNRVSEGNEGFSLLEVLVAVLVLAIVIIPLLHSFVSSHRVNARSREIMRATALAQNEMELFEKEKIEDLADPTKFDYRGWSEVVPTPDSNGCYTFVREGVVNDGSGRSMFDVVVELDPERASDTGRYYAQNTSGLFYLNTISNLDCATFIQPIKSNVNDPNNRFCDETVYDVFEANREGNSLSSSSSSTFKQSLARTITLKISQLNDGAKLVTRAKLVYEYFADDSMVKAGYQKYSKEQIIFDNSQELDEDGNPIELKGIYLFYTPRYDANVAGIVCEGVSYYPNVDKIVVENESKLPIDIYLIRQDVLIDSADEWDGTEDYNDWFDRNRRAVPVTYSAELEIHDYMDADGKTYGNYFTNLEGMVTNSFNITLEDLASARTYLKEEAIPLTKLRVIATDLEKNDVKASETKDRIYSMVVKVYRHVAGQSAETTATGTEPLVVMDGSKLE